MWTCPICSNREKSNFICGDCGFDKRSDFVKNRTLCSIDNEDLEYRNRIVRNKNNQNVLSEMLILYDELNRKYENSTKEIEALKKELKMQKENPNFVSNAEIHKKTKEVYSNGAWYEGDFQNGFRHGKGIFAFASGAKYEGDFQNGFRHGKGILVYPDGSKYEGDFQNDSKHGKGIYYYVDGSRYEGDYINDVHHGQGVYYYANGNYYEGDSEKESLRDMEFSILQTEAVLKENM